MPKSDLMLILFLSFILAGCADYMNHRDSVTLGSGSAADGNTAIQAVNPWPRNVSDTSIEQQGKYNPLGKPKTAQP